MHIHKSNSPLELTNAAKAKAAKRIYNATYAGFFTLLIASLFLGAGGHFWLWIWCSDIAKFIATRACRSLGLSQESSHSEVIQRDARAALAPLMSEAPTFSIGKRKRPRVRLSREGIEHRDWRGRLVHLAWSEVESCAWSTSRGVFGEHAGTCMVLKSREGKTLLKMCPSPQQAAHLIPAMRFYLRGEGIREEPTSI